MSAPPNNPYQVGRDLPPRPNQPRTVIHGRNLNPDVVMKGGRQLPPVDPPHVFKSDQPGQLPSDARRATTRIGGRRKKHHGHEINHDRRRHGPQEINHPGFTLEPRSSANAAFDPIALPRRPVSPGDQSLFDHDDDDYPDSGNEFYSDDEPDNSLEGHTIHQAPQRSVHLTQLAGPSQGATFLQPDGTAQFGSVRPRTLSAVRLQQRSAGGSNN